MLTPEQARDQLKALAIPDAYQRRHDAAGRLLGTAGTAGQALLQRWLPPQRNPVHLPSAAIGQILDDLDEGRRRKLLRRLHPTLGDLLAEAWVDLRRDPYATGCLRRAFRAPTQPKVGRAARADWLATVLFVTIPYEQPVPWFAAWAAHLNRGEQLGRLLAVAIDRGDDEVFQTLLATARGQHEVGRMGRHVPAALLAASREDGWDQVERLLLAAQREEGLRQVVLETVDLAHPEAFRRMLRLVVEEDLTRFAATVRAVGVWFGVPLEVTDRPVLDRLLRRLLPLLDDAAARRTALAGDDPGDRYLALWAEAFTDASTALQLATAALRDPVPDQRLAAAHLLAELGLRRATEALVAAIDDDDPRVTAVALQTLSHAAHPHPTASAPLRRLLARLPRTATVVAGIWKPVELTLVPADAADALLAHHGERDPRDLADVVHRMSPMGRARYVDLLANDGAGNRDALLALLGDRAEVVRRSVLRALGEVTLPAADAPRVEALLTRRSADLRRGALGLLLGQADADVVASAERLLAGSAPQRQAGIELLVALHADGRAGADLPARAATALDTPGLAPADVAALQAIVAPAGLEPAPAALLVRGADRTPASAPLAPTTRLADRRPGVERVLTSLDAWLAEHRDVEVTLESWGGPEVRLVADLGWLPQPHPAQPWDAQRARFPLADLLAPWWERTAPQLSDGGVEVLLAWAPAVLTQQALDQARQPWAAPVERPRWLAHLLKAAPGARLVGSLHHGRTAVTLLAWFAARELRPTWVDALLDATEEFLAAVPTSAVADLPTIAELLEDRHACQHRATSDWRAALGTWVSSAAQLQQLRPEVWSAAQRARLWHLARFLDEPGGRHDGAATPPQALPEAVAAWVGSPSVPRRPGRRTPPLALAVQAVEDGAATRADLVDLLLGERFPDDEPLLGFLPEDRQPLGELTRRRGHPLLERHPWLAGLVDEVRAAVLDVELARGDLPTATTAAALQLRSITGCARVAALLQGLGSAALVRGYIWRDEAKPTVFSKLLRGSFPAPGETPADFAAAVRGAGIPDKRLVALAVYAPQWALSVEAALGWPGLADAVHWLHAHTKDEQWQVDADVREEWAVQTHQRTPLSPADLVNGAVDVDWFARVRATLADARFDVLLKAARYASSSGGHKRAELFADALRGAVPAEALLERMSAKRHQDTVRALGLVPLPADDAERRSALLDRYERLRAWEQGSRRFGAQRRASEGLAVRIALENLARSAGYRDPQRLQWAMEAEAVRDLAAGPLTAVEGDVRVSLAIDAAGSPQVEVVRGERTLKSVPRAVAKRPAVAALTARAKDLRAQAKRMRASLEESAVRGDAFGPRELAELCAHPLLGPQLAATLVVTAEGILGWPRDGGQVLEGPDGAGQPADGSPLRIAHPVDLLASGTWSAWQRACFAGRVRQPFKQVFRELYVLTDAERAEETRSLRYAGQQVNPRQATALLGSRGWVVERERGALRTFHDEGVTALVRVLGGAGWGTPAEVEGMALEDVLFLPVDGEPRPLPLAEVPPRLFSEVMRDLDLVVSVAHAGGVDPEHSASTVDLRAALVRETADLLHLANVETTEHHALVTGRLGAYSVHLGSGVVHRRPGNALCLVPVGSQHRGRLFLPFVDDDPRTAEVLAKVVLLARDDQIKDPTVLEQLRA